MRPQDVVCPAGVVSALGSMTPLEAHAPPQHLSLLCMHLHPSQATLTSVLPGAREQQAGPHHVRMLRVVLFVLAAARDVLRHLCHLRIVQAQVRRALVRAYTARVRVVSGPYPNPTSGGGGPCL